MKCWRTKKKCGQKYCPYGVMQKCIENGIKHEGVLPGGLRVKRRAHQFHQRLLDANKPNIITSTLSAMEWINLFALAVNEENAAGGRVVTAPTNGAAGIIPAVLHYYMKFSPKACEEDGQILSATSVGILCKLNASISGAEVDCQGEVGSACAMAAAGLAEVLRRNAGTVERMRQKSGWSIIWA
jgi:L-serine dehydratase